MPRVLGESRVENRATSGKKDMSQGLGETLREAMRANPPLRSIDVSYTRRTSVPAEVYKKRIEGMMRLLIKKGKERGFSNLEFRSPGFMDEANEHVVLTSERVRIESPYRVRTDVTYFADDSRTTKTRAIVNMYYDGVFYFIDRTQQTIEIYEEPRFEGTGGALMLCAGKLSGHLKVAGVIVLASDPNSAVIPEGKVRKKCHCIGATEIAGMSSVQIECGDADDNKKDYDLFLDPNDLGLCLNIVQYDRKTLRIVETREYGQFRTLKGGGGLYPYIMTQRKYDPEGNAIETETIVVSDATTHVTISDQEFDLENDEFAGYEIIDHRSEKALGSGFSPRD